jgi:hypothetical protein
MGFATLIMKMKTLRALDLFSNGLESDGIKPLTTSLFDPKSSLVSKKQRTDKIVTIEFGRKQYRRCRSNIRFSMFVYFDVIISVGIMLY